MRAFIKKLWILPILILAFNIGVYAQFEEDEEFEDTQVEQIKCKPDTLTTIYDNISKEDSSQDIRLLYNFGREHYKNKSYRDALPYLWKVFILSDKAHDKYAKNAIKKIVKIYYSEKKADSTLIACYRGLERFPDMITLHYYAGSVQKTLNKISCAIPHYEKLVESDSTNISYLKILAKLYFSKNDERCIAIQQKVVDLKPDDADEARALANLKDHFYGGGAGIEDYKRAYEKNPDNVNMALIYGEAAVKAGEYADAIEPLTRVIKVKPSIEAYKLRAEAYENLNQTQKSINDLKAILKIDVTRVEDMVFIAKKYGSKNEFKTAKYWINRALSTKPGYGEAYIALGELYETSVSYCQEKRNGKQKYEDKLVYEKAYYAYKKAAKDPAFKMRAKTKIKYLKPYLPTEEDRFLHKKSKIKSPCYNWLK